MIKFLLKKLFILVITLWIIISIAFIMIRVAPGNPFNGQRPLPPEILANVMKSYNLDKPLWWQYFDYIKKILHGDFGPSLKILDFNVSQLIAISAPVSIELALSAIIIALILGVIFGSVAALRQNSKIDYFIMTFSMVGIVLPSYAIAPLLTLIFGIYLKLLPVAGWDGLTNKILPIIALSLPQIAYIARLTRGSMLEVLNTNFIRTAKAKGLPSSVILFKHSLKPAILPVISYLGPTVAGLMTGSVIIETIFDIPGLGRYFVQASLNRDYTLVMGIVIFYAFLVLILNFISDVIYAFLDPKINVE